MPIVFSAAPRKQGLKAVCVQRAVAAAESRPVPPSLLALSLLRVRRMAAPRTITRNIGTDPCKFTLTPRGIAGHPRRERRRVNSALVRLRNERRRIELQPSPIVGADVASLVDRRDGAADRLPRVGDAVRLGDDVHQSCELEDPSKKASWARGVAGRIKTAGGGLTSHLAPPGPFSSVFMETKTRTTTGRLSVRPASTHYPVWSLCQVICSLPR